MESELAIDEVRLVTPPMPAEIDVEHGGRAPTGRPWAAVTGLILGCTAVVVVVASVVGGLWS